MEVYNERNQQQNSDSEASSRVPAYPQVQQYYPHAHYQGEPMISSMYGGRTGYNPYQMNLYAPRMHGIPRGDPYYMNCADSLNRYQHGNHSPFYTSFSHVNGSSIHHR